MIEIKEVTSDDIEQILELFISVFSLPPWNEKWDRETAKNYLLDQIEVKRPFSYSLYQDDYLVGVSLGYVRYWYKGPEAVIGEFFIKSDVQHEGLGTTFMNALKKKAKENFISSIVLQTQKSNYAYDFYIKNGFVEDNNSVFLFNDIS